MVNKETMAALGALTDVQDKMYHAKERVRTVDRDTGLDGATCNEAIATLDKLADLIAFATRCVMEERTRREQKAKDDVDSIMENIGIHGSGDDEPGTHNNSY